MQQSNNCAMSLSLSQSGGVHLRCYVTVDRVELTVGQVRKDGKMPSPNKWHEPTSVSLLYQLSDKETQTSDRLSV